MGLSELVNKVRLVVHMGKTGAERLRESLERKKRKKKKEIYDSTKTTEIEF